MPSMHAYMDDFGRITIWMNRTFYNGRSDYFYLTSSSGLYMDLLVTGVEEHPDNIRYDLTAPADMEFGVEYYIHESHGLHVPLAMRLIAQKPAFAKQFDYAGDDLGSTYYPDHTDFCLWAPTATNVILRLHMRGREQCWPMKRTDKGVYRVRVDGDLKKATYTYYVTCNGETKETIDPYALSSTANSRESAEK